MAFSVETGIEDQPKADYKFSGFAEAACVPSGPRGCTHFLSDEGNLDSALLRLNQLPERQWSLFTTHGRNAGGSPSSTSGSSGEAGAPEREREPHVIRPLKPPPVIASNDLHTFRTDTKVLAANGSEAAGAICRSKTPTNAGAVAC
jgi:hypothetical protein